MKINCGPTAEEKYALKKARKERWHPYFALWPRRVGPQDCRWLEIIYRKGHLESWYDGVYWEYEYISKETYAQYQEKEEHERLEILKMMSSGKGYSETV